MYTNNELHCFLQTVNYSNTAPAEKRDKYPVNLFRDFLDYFTFFLSCHCSIRTKHKLPQNTKCSRAVRVQESPVVFSDGGGVCVGVAGSSPSAAAAGGMSAGSSAGSPDSTDSLSVSVNEIKYISGRNIKNCGVFLPRRTPCYI